MIIGPTINSHEETCSKKPMLLCRERLCDGCRYFERSDISGIRSPVGHPLRMAVYQKIGNSKTVHWVWLLLREVRVWLKFFFWIRIRLFLRCCIVIIIMNTQIYNIIPIKSFERQLVRSFRTANSVTLFNWKVCLSESNTISVRKRNYIF